MVYSYTIRRQDNNIMISKPAQKLNVPLEITRNFNENDLKITNISDFLRIFYFKSRKKIFSCTNFDHLYKYVLFKLGYFFETNLKASK